MNSSLCLGIAFVEKERKKSAMLKWGIPKGTDGVRHRPLTAS